MSAKLQHEKIIFGLAIKQLRQARNMSFADLAQASGLSVSYLNEIEKGKKYPKEEKLDHLMQALGLNAAALPSLLAQKHMSPVMELLASNFLNDLPLDVFGIELAKVAEIIAGAPAQVNAFISALLDISRNYALREEHFYFAALRAYLELHNNYFEDLEQAAIDCIRQFGIPDRRPLPASTLAGILEHAYGYCLDNDGLDAYPELNHLRAVFIPSQRRLLLKSSLSETQRSFQFGKEIGFNFLKLKQRAVTSSLQRGRSFEEVLNHARATYFSDALLLPLHPFVDDIRQFFALDCWDERAFLWLLDKYAATPEMFFHRLTNILPQFMGLDNLFFMRFTHTPATGTFEVDRELHLSRRHQPHGNAVAEHYCRRWITIRLLEALCPQPQNANEGELLARVQLSSIIDSNDQYLSITVARAGYPTPQQNVSVTLGLLVNDALRQKVRFLNDPTIQQRAVGTTCERCPLTDCTERAAPPLIITKKQQYQQVQELLLRLDGQL